MVSPMTKYRSLGLLGAGVAAAVTAALLVPTASAATVTSVEAETMTSVEGWGISVQTDSTASGGKRLQFWDNVSARKSFTLASPTTSYTVRARHDGGADDVGALIKIFIDGAWAGQWYVKATSWATYSVGKSLPAGSHTLKIQMLNAEARNLYVDVTRFLDSSTPTPSPTTTSPTPSPTPTTSSPPPSPAPTSTETRLQAYVTGYSWYDNTPPGSADIAYPPSAGYPTLHEQAGGTGTYANPVTVAVGHSLATGESVPVWPAGTRFYVPNLRRYFIVEDACGDGPTPQNGPCATGYPSPASTWLDVWVGGQNGTDAGADACMSSITDVWLAIKDPASNYVVDSGDIYEPPCTTQYGNTVVTV